MMKCKWVGLALAVGTGWVAAQQSGLFSVVKSEVLIGRQSDGVYVLPTGQLLRPWGEQAALRGRPVDMAFDASKNFLAILSSTGVSVREATSGVESGAVRVRSVSYAGIAFRPGTRELWASETTRNGPDAIVVLSVAESGKLGAPERINLEGHPVPTGIAFSPDGRTAYVALSRNNSLAVIDAEKRRMIRELAAGAAPFSVTVATKTERVFVTNRGGKRAGAGDTTAPSSGTPILTHPKTGAPVSGTVTVFDREGSRLKEIPVGMAPSGMALNPQQTLLAVANGHSDTVTFIDPVKLEAAGEVKIPVWPEEMLGSQPTNLVFSLDGKTVYVTCGGTNAVVVLTQAGKSWSVAGAVPTGWFPSAIALDKDGGLRVLNIKGTGNTSDGKGLFNSRQYEGSLLRLPPPQLPQLQAGLREVRAANQPKFSPAGGPSDLSALGIRHVFLIIKENRTYDQIFGDMPRGNGDPKLAIYGREVTPNHHALAEKYVLLDNFYASGAISFDGHHWLMQGFVSDYVERALNSAPRGYAWNMADALTVAPVGFFWQSAARPLDVKLYGALSLPLKWDPATQNAVDINEKELMPWTEYWNLYKSGKWRDAVGHRCGVPALAHLAVLRYPVSSMRIPDQIRAEAFLQDLAEREKSGNFPNLAVLTMTSDHTVGTSPGSPVPEAMVADNDLALGRIVEGISRSRFWANSLILVVEDDAQDGFDHVDGHRTVALAIGPNIRRSVVDSNYYDQTSMIRTIQDIFRIPPKTRYLKAARPMSSIFTTQRDLSPYKHIVPSMPLDKMNPPLKALSGKALWAAKQSAAMNWSHIDDVPSDLLNRILWGHARGYDTPYPRPPRSTGFARRKLGRGE